MTAPTCTNCAHFTLKKSAAIAKLGFGLCLHRSSWKWLAPSFTCPKHQPAPEAVVAARVLWLSSKGFVKPPQPIGE